MDQTNSPWFLALKAQYPWLSMTPNQGAPGLRSHSFPACFNGAQTQTARAVAPPRFCDTARSACPARRAELLSARADELLCRLDDVEARGLHMHASSVTPSLVPQRGSRRSRVTSTRSMCSACATCTGCSRTRAQSRPRRGSRRPRPGGT
jgi:hypothetical protein